jgi:hypothetical protein
MLQIFCREEKNYIGKLIGTSYTLSAERLLVIKDINSGSTSSLL